MPEVPDIEPYLEALRERVAGRLLKRSSVRSLFPLRSVEPPLAAVEGVAVTSLERLGKRIAVGFDNGALLLTEAGTKKRASLHAVRGRAALAQHDPGGIDVATATLAEFRAVPTRRNHTLKRALTDPRRLLSGIGNAYSDEIFHDDWPKTVDDLELQGMP